MLKVGVFLLVADAKAEGAGGGTSGLLPVLCWGRQGGRVGRSMSLLRTRQGGGGGAKQANKPSIPSTTHITCPCSSHTTWLCVRVDNEEAYRKGAAVRLLHAAKQAAALPSPLPNRLSVSLPSANPTRPPQLAQASSLLLVVPVQQQAQPQRARRKPLASSGAASSSDIQPAHQHTSPPRIRQHHAHTSTHHGQPHDERQRRRRRDQPLDAR